MINIAEIERRMKARNYTPGNVWKCLNRHGNRVSDREVRDILSGKVIPSWEHLVCIATMLDCTPWDLIIKKES